MSVIAQKLGLADKLEAPEIDDRSEYWIELFHILSPSRPVSDSGPRYIPLSEIKALIEMVPQPAANDEVVLLVRAMDGVFMEYVEGKRKFSTRSRG